MRLEGRVAWVTGATGALGRAVVTRLAADGARVVAAYRQAGHLEGLSGHVDATQVELTDPSGVARAVAEVLARQGRLDILVACAGGYSEAALASTSEEEWRWNLETNLTSAFHAVRAAWPHLLASGRGRIVTVSSREALHGNEGLAAYSASKGGLVRLTEAAAAEGAGHGVTANAVLPGMIDTPANREAMPQADFRRWVQPSAIAAVIAWLCTDEAAIVSGASLPVWGQS